MHQISVAGIAVEVVRKDIKNLHLGVYPPEGRVRIAAPLHLDDNAVRMAVISKVGWIRRQQKRFNIQQRQSPREYLSRESHYFLGRRYLLDVIEQDGPSRVELRNQSTITLYVPAGSGYSKRERVLTAWYRKEIKALIPSIIEKWEPILNVDVAAWGVKKMKTKWGSCNVDAHRIWLNLELVKKPTYCLEYVVVHEMLHLLERTHNDHFRELMDYFMPQWQFYRDELNQAPLCHETWID